VEAHGVLSLEVRTFFRCHAEFLYLLQLPKNTARALITKLLPGFIAPVAVYS